jgi:DNA (cytosine-5)-methyltransferase 1
VLVAIENVCGTLTSHGGRDFQAICSSFAQAGYRFGALVINAELFVPQSRPRLFVVGVREDLSLEPRLLSPEPREPFHPHALRRAVAALPQEVREKRLWWRLPLAEPRESSLSDLIEDSPNSVRWHTREDTERLLALMSKVNFAKVEAARRSIRRRVGCVYRRTRRDEKGARLQRAEVRFDEVAGCLRTPAGGSSRQVILVVEGAQVRSRLISARETARLMGLPDSYELPEVYNDAYHLTGDGVVVDVVAHLARHLFEPVLDAARAAEQRAA